MTGPAVEPPPPKETAVDVQDRLLQVGAIALVVLLVYLLFRPILPALMWGALLAIISAHGYERLVGRLNGRRGIAVTIFGLLYCLTLITPLVVFIVEAIALGPFLSTIPERLASDEVVAEIEHLETVIDVETGLPDWLRTLQGHIGDRMSQLLPYVGSAATWLATWIGELGAFFLEFLLGCVTALVLLYNRFAVRAVLSHFLDRVGGGFAQGLMQQTFDMTRDAFRGVIVAAMAQTGMSAIALLAAGLPGVVLLSALTFLMAMVQVGPIVTGLISGGMLLFDGRPIAAGLIIAWFFLVIGSIDNLIRPYVASRSNETPAFLTFLGAFGGLLAFGLIGAFIGPVLIALMHVLASSWLDEGTRSASLQPKPTEEGHH